MGIPADFFEKCSAKAGGWEVVAHRVVWSLLVMLLLLVIFKSSTSSKKLSIIFAEQKQYAICLTLAAAFAGVNWWINIYGVNSNQVVELGIGMFLTPLISVFLEFFFTKRNFRRLSGPVSSLPSWVCLSWSSSLEEFHGLQWEFLLHGQFTAL